MNRTEFKNLYLKKLRPRLKILDRKRSNLLGEVVIANLVIVVAFVYFTKDFFSFDTFSKVKIQFIFSMITVLGFILGILNRYLLKPYRSQYKEHIAKEIMGLFLEDVYMDMEGKIDSTIFDSSMLNDRSYNRYGGEDYISSIYKHLKFELSELRVSHVSGSGRNRSESIVFKGIMITLENLNRTIPCPIVISRDRSFKLLGGLLDKNKHKGMDQVHLEDVNFEKHFNVYSTDQIQSRKILTPRIMERFVKIKLLRREAIEVSFIGRNIYVLIHTTKDHFEPRLFGSLVNYKDIQEIYTLFEFFDTLVNELELNPNLPE